MVKRDISKHSLELERERTRRWRESHPNYIKDYYNLHKEYLKKKSREYRSNNKERHNILESQRRYKLKIDVMKHYSNPIICKMCGIDDIRILSIDHINENGAQHKRENNIPKGSIPLYKWIRDNNYPDGFQILCMNCNFIKHLEFKNAKKKSKI